MTTAEQVLAVARSQIGTVQARDGSNPYGRAYGMDRVAWCQQFVHWCFAQAGGSGLIHPKTAYTPTAADHFRRLGRFDRVPRVGDCVFFDWPNDGVDRISHVGLVEAVEDGALVTIEGNTTSGNAGDQRMGGGVWRRRRAMNASVIGFGHPDYATPAPTVQEDDMTPEERARQVRIEQKLDLLLQQLVVGGENGNRLEDPKTWGWTGWGGGTGEKLTVVDQGRRTNVEVRQTRVQLDKLAAQVGALAEEMRKRPATGSAAAATPTEFAFTGVATPR